MDSSGKEERELVVLYIQYLQTVAVNCLDFEKTGPNIQPMRDKYSCVVVGRSMAVGADGTARNCQYTFKIYIYKSRRALLDPTGDPPRPVSCPTRWPTSYYEGGIKAKAFP